MTKQIKASDYFLKTSKEYSVYVCSNRAIPRVTDGLKNGQRQALWTIRNKAEKIKVISLAGEMISTELYLHGDTSAASTISLLAAPYCNNLPLLEGKGTFGTRVSPVEGIGASRYVYVKRGSNAQNLIYQDMEIIPLKDNHDGSRKEPVTFLPIIPTVLLNGIAGIAVGWSTQILPRNIDDIINATIAALDGKKIKPLIPTYNYFNVTTKQIKTKPNETNSWEFEGKATIIDAQTIRVTELPPDLTLKKFRERLTIMEEDGKIRDFIDRSKKAIEVDVKFKRGTVKGWSSDKAIKFLKLTTRKKERIVVLDWDSDAIRQYNNAEDVVRDFVEWRFNHYITRYERLRDKTTEDLNFWKGVKLCFDKNLPKDLTKMKNKAEVHEKVTSITKTINLNDSQIERIVGFSSYRWAQDGYQQCLDKIAELDVLLQEYIRLLNNPNDIKDIFKDEVKSLKKTKFTTGR